MPRLIVLDTFPLSSTAKREPNADETWTTLNYCHQWIKDCVAAGNRVVVPSIAYYEAVRELERLNATQQIARLRSFCHAVPDRFLPITDAHLEHAAKLWAQSRNAGTPTASPESLDADVILVAQALSLSEPFVIATTNTKHLNQFAPAELWTNITP